MVTVLLAPTAALARSVNPTVSIEAEYGQYVAEGSLYTAAHHQKSGKYQGRHTGGSRPAPCNDPSIPELRDGDTVLLSHLDLDSVGGALRTMGYHLFTEEDQDFWGLAEFVDVNGPHRLDPSNPQCMNLNAWWAWLQANRLNTSRDSVTDVTEFITLCGEVITCILNGDTDLLQLGEEFAQKSEQLNMESLFSVAEIGKTRIAIRVADQFVNHLYRTPDGVADAVLALNSKLGSVTLSFEDGGNERFSARDIIQAAFPDKDQDGNFLAGGHPGIAGSPRGQMMTVKDLSKVLSVLQEKVKGE